MNDVSTLNGSASSMSVMNAIDEPPTTQGQPVDSFNRNQEQTKVMETYKDKFFALWENPKYRIGMILGGVVFAASLFFYIGGGDKSSAQSIQGDQTTAAEVGMGDGAINAEQAAYLQEQRRQEALRMQSEGQSNAAVIITPTDQINNGFQNGGAVGFGTPATAGENITPETISAKYAHVYYKGRSVHNHPSLEVRKDSMSDRYYFWDDEAGVRLDVSEDGKSLINASTGYNANQSAPVGQGDSASGGSNGTNGGSDTQVASNDDNREQDVTNQANSSGSGMNYDALQDADIQYYNSKLAYNFDAYQYNNQKFGEAQALAQDEARKRAEDLRNQRAALSQSSFTKTLDKIKGVGQSSAGFGTRVYGTTSNQDVNPTVAGDDAQNSRATGFSTPPSAQQSTQQPAQANTANSPLPNNIVRAGTTYQVVVTKTANSDVGNVVQARIANGPFAGSTVYGVMSPKGRDVAVNFTSIQRPNPRLPIIAVKAVAENFNAQKAQISTSVNRHYVQNYTHAAATSALKGYGDAYSSRNRAGTTIERSDGTVITTTEGQSTSREVKANIAQDFSERLQKDFEYLGDRPPTFIIKAGTLLNMRITSDWDTTQTTNTIPE